MAGIQNVLTENPQPYSLLLFTKYTTTSPYIKVGLVFQFQLVKRKLSVSVCKYSIFCFNYTVKKIITIFRILNDVHRP